MCNYVVIARFDCNTEKKLNKFRKSFEKAGYPIPEWPVHITIAAYENMDEKGLCDWTGDFCKEHKKVKLDLCALGMFPQNKGKSVLYLAPAYSKIFVDFYYEFHQKYKEFCTGIGRYNAIVNNSPSIHCTIAEINVRELQKAIDLSFKSNSFRRAEIVALEVYTYPMRLIKRFELQ